MTARTPIPVWFLITAPLGCIVCFVAAALIAALVNAPAGPPARGKAPHATPAAPSPRPAVPPRDWRDASREAATAGEVEVSVVSARWERARVRLPDGSARPVPTRAFRVTLAASNRSAGRIVTFDPWVPTHDGVFGTRPPRFRAKLSDSFGNVYGQAPRVKGADLAGHLEWARVRPGGSAEGSLFFVERPLPNAEWLLLELDAGAFEGSSGTLRFRIPPSMIGKDEE